MRIRLTVEVDAAEREAIARQEGKRGLVTHAEARDWLMAVLDKALIDAFNHAVESETRSEQ